MTLLGTLEVTAESPKMKMTTSIPGSIETPDSVTTRIGELNFFDGYRDAAAAERLYDYLDFMRGVEAFLSAIPGASAEALRVGMATQGADNNQTILIFESLMDSRSLFLTPNTETVYNLMWLDTTAGPLVFETPPNVLGIVDDHWFQFVGDFGNAGQDRGQGGKYLLLPPGYEGDIPDGYFVAIHANEALSYEEVNDIVQYEPSDSFHPEVLGQLAAIGIEKGKPFAPDERMKAILAGAVSVGNAMARTITFRPGMPEAYYYPDSAWYTGFVGGSYEFLSQKGVRDRDARTLFHYYATGITPAMALKRVGIGSQYAIATTDKDGQPFDGSKTYKVHLPPDIPAGSFWSFVIYDNQTRSMLQTDQQFPSTGSNNKELVANPDGTAIKPGMVAASVATMPAVHW